MHNESLIAMVVCRPLQHNCWQGLLRMCRFCDSLCDAPAVFFCLFLFNTELKWSKPNNSLVVAMESPGATGRDQRHLCLIRMSSAWLEEGGYTLKHAHTCGRTINLMPSIKPFWQYFSILFLNYWRHNWFKPLCYMSYVHNMSVFLH